MFKTIGGRLVDMDAPNPSMPTLQERLAYLKRFSTYNTSKEGAEFMKAKIKTLEEEIEAEARENERQAGQ